MDDGKSGYDPSPVNPLPPVVIVLFLMIFAVEALVAAGAAGLIGGAEAVGWRLNLAQTYAFSPELFQRMMELGQWPGEHLLRFVTYPFLHQGFVQMAIAAVIFLAMGKLVGEAMGQIGVIIMFFGGSIVGALAYGLVPGQQAWLLGSFPGAYGLIGGFTFIMWTRALVTGQSQSQAFSLIAMLMGIQLLFGVLFGGDNLWVADLAGFITGFASCFIIVPGARRALLDRLRQR
ncbi:MAG: rhomboid family intramembrane serine protease [Paracoccaceae bacterium]